MLDRAVFLDRDGVLIDDAGLILRPEDVRIIAGVPAALRKLHVSGFRLIVVSNQAVVARGLLSEEGVVELQRYIARQLVEAGAPSLDGWYFCPHHPNATLPEYRVVCECRKPRPGLLLRAARELGIDPKESIMIGDRITDIVAGARAGCKTILAETGAHRAPVIQTAEEIDRATQPDYRCPSLPDAVGWILDTL